MITPEQLANIGEWISGQPMSDGIDRQLRQRFPQLHFTYCMDDDVIAAAPVYEHAAFNLYLVDSSDHCFRLTQDMAAANGLVVAETEDPS